jgi:hypothetical protein
MFPRLENQKNAKRSGQRQRGGRSTRQNNDKTVRLHKHIIPDRTIVPLRYYWATAVLNNTGNQTASHQLLLNGVYDVDASLGSTSTIGFNQWATLYNKYRAVHFTVNAIFINLDAVPTFACIAFTNTSFSTNTFNQSYWGDDYSRWSPLGQSTGNDTSRKMSLSVSIQDLVGDRSAISDADYSATTNSNPAKLVYGELAISSGASSVTMSSGALVRYELIVTVEFFSRVALTD